MTVKKILCVGGALLISGHESSAAEKVVSLDKKQVVSQSFCNNVEVVSQPFCRGTFVNGISSAEASVQEKEDEHLFEYPYISPSSQEKNKKSSQIQAVSSKKMIQKTRKLGSSVFVYRPIYRGEKRALTPPAQGKVVPSWSAPKPKWQGLNVHHHARKFDRAYIRSKTIA